MARSFESVSPFLIAVVCLLAPVLACIPPDVDAFFTINASRPIYRFEIAKHIRDSELWRTYLEYLSGERTGRGPVVAIDVTFEREVTERNDDGDYDPGVVHATVLLEELRTRTILLNDQKQFDIPNHVVIRQASSREEVQDLAFAEVEKKAVRSLLSSLDLAIVRAMGGEGSKGTPFISVLQDIHENHWNAELATEAGIALDAIR